VSHKDNITAESWSFKLNSLQPKPHHNARKETSYEV